MNGSAKALICGISYELGALYPIDDVLLAGQPEETLAALREKGLETYSRIDEGVLDAVKRCVTNTMNDAGIASRDLSSVMFVTETFTGVSDAPPAKGEPIVRAYRNLLIDALAEAGVTSVPVFCTTFGGSSNFLQALFALKPIVEHTPHETVLLVCLDRLPPGTSRIMDVAVAVTGDGVASCLIARESRGNKLAFEIQRVGITAYAHKDRNAGWNRLVLEMYRATKAAAADCYDSVDCQPGDFAWLVVSNYNAITCQVFTRLLGFDSGRTFVGNASRTGHIPSCDPLVNLRDLASASELDPGSRILVYSNGPISCGTIGLVVR